jgi:hypothetical protein
MSDEKFNWPAKNFFVLTQKCVKLFVTFLPVSYIGIFWVTTLNTQTMKSEVRACERLSAYFRKFCLEETGHDLLCIRDLTVVVLDLSSPAIYRVFV